MSLSQAILIFWSWKQQKEAAPLCWLNCQIWACKLPMAKSPPPSRMPVWEDRASFRNEKWRGREGVLAVFMSLAPGVSEAHLQASSPWDSGIEPTYSPCHPYKFNVGVMFQFQTNETRCYRPQGIYYQCEKPGLYSYKGTYTRESMLRTKDMCSQCVP